MKVTKLIIPILGLSQINNNANKELLQIEKMPEVSYEVSTVDNWDNYFYLTNANETEKLVQQSEIIQLNNQRHESGKLRQLLTTEQCLDIYYRTMATCAFLGPFAPGCVALAQLTLAGCLAAANG